VEGLCQTGEGEPVHPYRRTPGWTACSQIVTDRRKRAIGLGLDEATFLQGISRRLKNPIPATLGRGGAPVKEVRLMGEEADLLDLRFGKTAGTMAVQ
jgi:hypothetical protein